MTTPLSRLGACCASGTVVWVRRDPWTGDERCAHCGLPVPLPNTAGAALHGAESPETPVIVARSGSDQTLTVSATPVDEPPPVMGGQGRDASEVEADGVSTVRLVVLAILSVGILALGVWAAGGGR